MSKFRPRWRGKLQKWRWSWSWKSEWLCCRVLEETTLKRKRGEHRAFRLAENLCMNLTLSMRELFFVKRDGKVAENISLVFFNRLPW